MIAIDNVLLSDQVVEARFVCDLDSCKGGCCVEGDCGAPITEVEAAIIKDAYPKIKKYLPQEHIDAVEQHGTHDMDDEYGHVTPTINGGICVYAFTDELGIVKCGFEQAWKNKEIEFQKPISCHLYPIRIKKFPEYEAVNYEPRKQLCRPACKLGKKLEVPVYQFLKDALVRNYGQDFYDRLDATAKHMKEER